MCQWSCLGFLLVILTNFVVRQLLLLTSQLGLTWVQEIQCSGWKNSFEKVIAEMRFEGWKREQQLSCGCFCCQVHCLQSYPNYLFYLILAIIGIKIGPLKNGFVSVTPESLKWNIPCTPSGKMISCKLCPGKFYICIDGCLALKIIFDDSVHMPICCYWQKWKFWLKYCFQGLC